MSFTEPIRPYPYPRFDDQEVHEVGGGTQPVLKLQPSNFEGPVSHWANDKMRILGETIVPRQVYIIELPKGKSHRVAWIYHEGVSPHDDEPFCMHHVACDCSGDIDRVETEEERQEIAESCPGLKPALDAQADRVNSTYLISEVLDGLSYVPSESLEEQSPLIQHFIVRSLMHLLERDFRHPESWIANMESGWTMPGVMSKVLGVRPEDVNWLAESLAAQDELQKDEEVFGLSLRHKRTIATDKQFREVMEGQGIAA